MAETNLDRRKITLHDQFRQSLDMLLMVAFLLIIPTIMYGWRPLYLTLFGAISGYVIDLVLFLVRGKTFDYTDLTGAVTGAVFTLLLPASSPYWLVFIGILFAIGVVEHAFGGGDNYIFNSVAGAFAFVTVTWPTLVFSYPKTFTQLPIFADVTTELINGPSYVIKLGGVPNISNLEMLTGNFPGFIGSSSIIILICCGIYLQVRKVISMDVSLSFMATAGLICFFFPRVSTGRLNSLMLEMLTGGIVFAAIFIVNNPVSTPKRRDSRIVYGVLLGALTMAFRYFGAYELGAVFAVTLCSPLCSFLDRTFAQIEARSGGVSV